MQRDPVKIVRLAGGSASAADIVAFSGRRRLAAALEAGRLVRARRGVYALPALPDALMLAAELGGVVSHASAAQLMGVGLVHAPVLVDITVRRGSRPRRHPQARIHWARQFDESDVENGLTVPVRTVLDCAASLPFGDALAVADGLLSMSYLREKDLLTAAYASRGRGRTARIRVAEAADRRAENAFESALRALVLEAGVGGFVPQVRIRLPRRVLFADLGDVERRLVLEADSFEHHGSRGALVRDCDRYNDLVAAGWNVLRFPWENVVLWPDRVTAVLVETCARLDTQRRRIVTSGPSGRTESRTNP